jgi:ferredoxin
MLEWLKIHFFEVFHVFFRHFNFPCELGLRTIGRPDSGSPVFLSGNYTLTVHRLLKRLRPFDCYLIVANSKGSNVWCAAGMNEFNEFDIIDAITVSRIKDKVRGRKIIAPPYAAPGVDAKEVLRQTGFRLVWGPTHFDDLPAYIAANYRRTSAMTQAQFGLSDRIEQALSTSLVYCMTIFPLAFFFPAFTLALMAMIFALHLSWFGLWDVFPEERHWAKTLTHLGVVLAGLGAVAWSTEMAVQDILLWAATLGALVLLISLDGCGSSTIYKTTPQRWLAKGDYRSHFDPIIDPDKCTNCYDCIPVCPKGVLARVPKGPAVSVRPDACIECLACVKACHDDAFYNRSQVWKGDVKSIDNLKDIMTRDWRHLEAEMRWIDAPVRYDKHMLVVDLSAMAAPESQDTTTTASAGTPAVAETTSVPAGPTYAAAAANPT